MTDYRAWYINDAGLTCTQICLINQITINLFTEANPSLNKTTCDKDLVQGNSYCVNPLDGWNWGSGANSTTSPTPTISAPSTPPAPTQTGIPANCNAFYVAKAGDDCGTVTAKFGITKGQFHEWNPAISSDCSSGFWAKEAYCVGVSGTSSTPITSISASTPTSTSASTLVVPPAPTQSGIPANCDAYYVAQAGDDCDTVASKFQITKAQFHEWNPAISSDCSSGFWAEEAYCVGVFGTSSATSLPTPNPVSTGSVVPPAPTQSGIPENCSKYYVAQAGDTCATIVDKFGITNDQFHLWNPAVSVDCVSGFMADEAYCIALS